LRQLRQASALPIEVDVPFWWADQQTANGPLMDRLAAVVDGVTVMNYRTDLRRSSAWRSRSWNGG